MSAQSSDSRARTGSGRSDGNSPKSDDESPTPTDSKDGIRDRIRTTVGRVDEWFAALRADDRRRRGTLGVAVVVGLALSWIHWLGLVVGGALVGLTRVTVTRAVLAGFGFGTLVLGTFLVTTPAGVDGFFVLSPASYLTVLLALGLPAIGAIARGVV